MWEEEVQTWEVRKTYSPARLKQEDFRLASQVRSPLVGKQWENVVVNRHAHVVVGLNDSPWQSVRHDDNGQAGGVLEHRIVGKLFEQLLDLDVSQVDMNGILVQLESETTENWTQLRRVDLAANALHRGVSSIVNDIDQKEVTKWPSFSRIGLAFS